MVLTTSYTNLISAGPNFTYLIIFIQLAHIARLPLFLSNGPNTLHTGWCEYALLGSISSC